MDYLLYAGLIGYTVGIVTSPWVFYLIRKGGRWLAKLTVRKYK